jgi:hypothetical protein
MEAAPLTPQQKALSINLDAAVYGTFAEIGAGQEVARWFFHVGGAAGTVARTVSAYDMAMSDAIYGRSDRYVSRARLEAMLDHELNLLLERLTAQRGDKNAFFVFADTVATRSYSRHADGDGWMGVRLQTAPRSAPSEIIVHVFTRDSERVREQEALGILGVNLVYGAVYYRDDPPRLIGSLLDNLTRERIEIDMIKFSGPAFAGVDNRLMTLQLVEQRHTDATMFTAAGEVVQPSEVLYKKAVLVERGRFRPPTKLTLDMLERAQEQFLQDSETPSGPPVILMEMTLRDLGSAGGVDHRDFLARVDVLAALGKDVLISNYAGYFRLAEYLSRYTQQRIGIAADVGRLQRTVEGQFSKDLAGGVLEALGRLFKHNVRVYVYPIRDPASGEIITAETMAARIAPQFRHLYLHLLENRFVEPVRRYDAAYLGIDADDVLRRIATGDPTWEAAVPAAVVQTIKRDRLFGLQPVALGSGPSA